MLVPVLALLAGCAASSSEPAAVSTSRPVLSPTPMQVTSYASPKDAAGAACQIFARFQTDLLQLTPHAAAQLISDLTGGQNIVQAAIQSRNDKLFADVNDLVAYVGSSAFSTSGRPDGAPVQAMAVDCGGP